MTYAPAMFEVAKFNGLGDAFTRKYSFCPLTLKVIQNVTQHPLHHVIYAPTKLHHVTFAHSKFEVATSKGLEG